MCFVDGCDILCFVLISLEVGLDVGVIFDVVIVMKGEYNGEEVFGLWVSWDKCYIMLVLIVMVFGLVFKVFDLE